MTCPRSHSEEWWAGQEPGPLPLSLHGLCPKPPGLLPTRCRQSTHSVPQPELPLPAGEVPHQRKEVAWVWGEA